MVAQWAEEIYWMQEWFNIIGRRLIITIVKWVKLLSYNYLPEMTNKTYEGRALVSHTWYYLEYVCRKYANSAWYGVNVVIANIFRET